MTNGKPANFLFILLTLLFAGNAFGQRHKLITGNFTATTFDRFVKTVESETSYRFFYHQPDLDSFQVNAQVVNATIDDLLKQVFQGTSYFFITDTLNHIYITKNRPIIVDLPSDYFIKAKPSTDTLNEQERYSSREELLKQKIKSPIENKLFEIGIRSGSSGKEKVVLSGYIKDAKNGESISGAYVNIDSSSSGVLTDQYGYYTITISRGRHTLHVSSTGMKTAYRQIMAYSDGKLNIELVDYIPSLKEIIVTAQRNSNVKGLQMGVERLNTKTIKQVPVVFGEADLLKVVLALPGVTSSGEASTGLNVRGGSADQNLILYNDATIYNPTHLFGFFSAFNADAVKNVELYKSAIPEKYGGRLSSVLDVTSKEGNSKTISGIGGIGPLTGKIMIEGPIAKNKTTFIGSARSSYSNWLLHLVPDETYKNSSANFSDIDLHVSHTINNRNSLYLNGYWSNDRFSLNRDTIYRYGNRNLNLKWKHYFNDKFYQLLTAGSDYYHYAVTSKGNAVNAYHLSFDIQHTMFRADYNYNPGKKHAISFGLNTLYYNLHPGSLLPDGNRSLIIPDHLEKEQALESAIYFGDQYSITPNLALNAGLRYSLFHYLGPHDVYRYLPGLPRDKNTLIDTTRYSGSKVIQTYGGPEIRAALRYTINDNSSVKLSYNSLRQYIHMLSNTTSISPTDIWKLSDPNIKPQTGEQLSLGYYRNFQSNNIETSLEIYYKRMRNFLDYKSDAQLIMNHHIETDVTPAEGKAYGAELLIKKISGKLNGWLSYTYSRTLLRSNDPLAGEVINNGHYYPSNYDKPHNLNLISNYRFTHRYSLSFNIVYSTGRPLTLPIAVFDLGGAQRVLYSERNQYRIPNYFRSDLSFIIEGNHKIKKLTHNSWSIGVYNLTGRKNPYSIYFKEESGTLKGYQLSIFGTLIPFVTYNFRF